MDTLSESIQNCSITAKHRSKLQDPEAHRKILDEASNPGLETLVRNRANWEANRQPWGLVTKPVNNNLTLVSQPVETPQVKTINVDENENNLNESLKLAVLPTCSRNAAAGISVQLTENDECVSMPRLVLAIT